MGYFNHLESLLVPSLLQVRHRLQNFLEAEVAKVKLVVQQLFLGPVYSVAFDLAPNFYLRYRFCSF